MSDNHNASYYVRWYIILLVLLVVSIIGPEFGIKALTLFTAFGIAVVKAYIVAAYFMHLNVEKRYIHYMMYTMLAFMGIFYFGTAVDIMKHDGSNWVNQSSIEFAEKHKMDGAEKSEED